MDSFNTVLGNIDELPGPSRQVNMNTRFRLLVLSFNRFERALNNSARETLKRARQRFHSTAIATEQEELFGYGNKSSKCSKGKKKVCPSPWTKQFYCLAYCNQDHV